MYRKAFPVVKPSLEDENLALRKHVYSNILKISPPKTKKFSDKNSDFFFFFSYFCSKHRLWVLVRIASPWRF